MMLLSCTETGNLLNISKEEVMKLVFKEVLGNYGNSHRSMIHEDELREYIRLLNGEVTQKEFEDFKLQTRSLYELSFLNDIEYMKNTREVFKHEKINTTQKYIDNGTELISSISEITYSQLEKLIFREKEELEERIFKMREENPQNEKAIFQYQCEIRGIDRVLEIIEVQKDNRKIL